MVKFYVIDLRVDGFDVFTRCNLFEAMERKVFFEVCSDENALNTVKFCFENIYRKCERNDD